MVSQSVTARSASEMHRPFVRWKTFFEIFVWAAIGISTPIRAIQSCDIPSVYEKQSTFLSCAFDTDISTTNKIITVLHYPTNDSDNPVTVVFSAVFQGNLQYFTRPGFTIIGNVTNTLKVRINSVTRDHTGKYECHVMPSASGNVASCNFIIKDLVSPGPDTRPYIDNKNTPFVPVKQSCDIQSVQEHQVIYLSCSFDADISTTKKAITVLHYPTNDSNNPVTVVYSALFQGNLQYFTRPGFTVIGNVTNTLRVRINSVTRDRNGKFECHVTSSTPGNVAPCNFFLKGDQSCDIPLVQENEIIFLSCNFDADISTSKKTITVLHYPTNDPDNPVTVVYSALFQGKLEYFTHPGFTVTDNVTNTLILRINSPTRDHTGKYYCHIPSTPGTVASCKFFVKATDSLVALDTSKDVEDSKQYVKPWVILCSVALLFAVGIIIALVVLYKLLMRKAEDPETGSKEHMIPDNGPQPEHNQH